MRPYFALFYVSLLSAILILPSTGLAASRTTKKAWSAHPYHRASRSSAVPVGYSPSQIRHAYGFDQRTENGLGHTIAITVAYDNPAAAPDLSAFIHTFKLSELNGLDTTHPCTVATGPHPCFQKIYAQEKPRTNSGWALESSLDLQWAHAISPAADLLLVESATPSLPNLIGAVDMAVKAGAAVVSMSWGGPEFSGEEKWESHFSLPGVSFVAASGDSGSGTSYPAISPHVVAVGGTTLSLDQSGNLLGKETAWKGSGGGVSQVFTQPGYQVDITGDTARGKRAIPDVAYNADPQTGFATYSQLNGGWISVGGTSAGAPQWAALIELSNHLRHTLLSTTNLAHSPYYSAASIGYTDVNSGRNGRCRLLCKAQENFDFVTGLGSPKAEVLLPFLERYQN